MKLVFNNTLFFVFLTHYIHCSLQVILSHPLLFQQFNPLSRHNSESSKLLTNLISVVAKKASCCNALQGYLIPYKDKLLVSLMTAIKTMQKKKKSPRGNVVFCVDAFPLQFQEISDLLVSLSNLPSTSMVVSDASEMSQWCLLTTNLLSRASDLRTKGSLKEGDIMILPSTVILQVSNWLLEMLPSSSCDFSPLVDAFLQYIKSCPQQTCHIPHVSSILTQLSLIYLFCSLPVFPSLFHFHFMSLNF